MESRHVPQLRFQSFPEMNKLEIGVLLLTCTDSFWVQTHPDMRMSRAKGEMRT